MRTSITNVIALALACECLLLIEEPSYSQTPCSSTLRMCSAGEQDQEQHLLETVKGNTIVGSRRYALSFTPAQQSITRGFRNGVMMTPGVEYTIRDSIVSLNSAVPIENNDIFQFGYSVETKPAVQDGQSISDVRESNEVIDRYLQHALAQELANVAEDSGPPAAGIPLSRTSKRPAGLSSSTLDYADPTLPLTAEPGTRSFRLLSEYIDSYNRRKSNLINSTKHSIESEGLKGVEGLGDEPMENTSLGLTSYQAGSTYPPEGLTIQQAEDSSKRSPLQLRSLRLLRRRIWDLR